MLLQQHLELATRAHSGTSFSPERRGAQYIKDYSEQLAADMEKVEQLRGDKEAYRQKYESLFVSWMHTKSRCLSSMITGPSGFPVRRAEKARNSEHNQFQNFDQWRDKYFARLERDLRREARATSDPLAEMRTKVAEAEKLQEWMKAINKVVKGKQTSEVEKVEQLMELFGIGEARAIELMQPDFCGRIGFSYQLTNNLANIKRMHQRVAELEKKAQATEKETERADGVRIVENTYADRLQIFFPEKPSPEMIATLKGRGFKWAPSVHCWQRQLTDNARFALRYIFPATH